MANNLIYKMFLLFDLFFFLVGGGDAIYQVGLNNKHFHLNKSLFSEPNSQTNKEKPHLLSMNNFLNCSKRQNCFYPLLTLLLTVKTVFRTGLAFTFWCLLAFCTPAVCTLLSLDHHFYSLKCWKLNRK